MIKEYFCLTCIPLQDGLPVCLKEMLPPNCEGDIYTDSNKGLC